MRTTCVQAVGEIALQPFQGHDHLHLGIFQREAQPLGGQLWIQRQVGPARLEHAQQRHDQLGRSRQPHGHEPIRSHAPRRKVVGQLVGPLVQLAIRPLARAVDQRHRVRRLLGPGREEIMMQTRRGRNRRPRRPNRPRAFAVRPGPKAAAWKAADRDGQSPRPATSDSGGSSARPFRRATDRC